MPATTALSLSAAIAALREFYGRPQPLPTNAPFELILLENVAYLAPAARRREAFELLQQTIGTEPEAILAATRASLERVTAYGILKSRFAAKLRECAQMVVDLFAGNLDAAMQGPIENARRVLRKFPGIGEPTADKILLFSGRLASLAPESNGLRVLARLGFFDEKLAYVRMYRASLVAAEEFSAKIPALQEGHLLLHQHGQTLCKRASPQCGQCPLASECAHVNRYRARS
jgi:A/G-specific adenine glycosylase